MRRWFPQTMALMLLLVTVGPAFARPIQPSALTQIAPPARIDTILVTGNRTTKRFVILNEIELRPGDIADEKAMRDDQERLESIALFSHARLTLVRTPDERNALLIDVTELWYIWPGLYLAIDEQDASRVAYGLILSDENFRGRRERVSINGRVGFTHGVEFDWEIPYLVHNRADFSMHVDAGDVTENEPRYLRDRKNIQARDRFLGVSFGHRVNLQNSFFMKSRISERSFSPFNGRTTIASDLSGSNGATTSLEVQVGGRRDTRTYRPWASSGYVVNAGLSTSFDVNTPDIAYIQPFLALGGVVSPAERFHIAARTELTSFVGNPPLYRQFVLNRDNGVRTAMSASYEGVWRSIGSLELRGDLLPIRYITLPSFEFMQRYSRNLKFGISATLFVDGGVVGGATASSSNLPNLQATDGWEVSYGAGLVFHVPYRDILRLEAARSGRFPSDGILVRFRVGPLF